MTLFISFNHLFTYSVDPLKFFVKYCKLAEFYLNLLFDIISVFQDDNKWKKIHQDKIEDQVLIGTSLNPVKLARSLV
jgi:hypothetical protein